MNTPQHTLHIVCISDGRPGHDTQSEGLAAAIARIVPAKITHTPARGWLRNLRSLASGKVWRDMGNIDLVIGAGHGTHLSLLSAKRELSCPAIVLMSPSLPLSLFDLCVIPQHDGQTDRPNVIQTLGAITTLEPRTDHIGEIGLILIGGPSNHYGWDEPLLLNQIREIVKRSDHRWYLTNSPRTPTATSRQLKELAGERLHYQAHERVSRDWIIDRLQQAPAVWVSRDSISMICESLSIGAPTGLLEVPEKPNCKLRQTTETLLERHLLKTFQQWQQGQPLSAPDEPLQEATRVAGEIVQRLSLSTPGP
ncbi:MAG: mitochondrial fission ELM1 family protein [Gammaproteobacteria bacterium]